MYITYIYMIIYVYYIYIYIYILYIYIHTDIHVDSDVTRSAAPWHWCRRRFRASDPTPQQDLLK